MLVVAWRRLETVAVGSQFGSQNFSSFSGVRMGENSVGCAGVGSVALVRYGGEPVLSVVELSCDVFLDLWVQRGVRAECASVSRGPVGLPIAAAWHAVFGQDARKEPR
jgi:hypothetical protein